MAQITDNMKKIILYFSLLLIFAQACKKNGEHEFIENTISGQLFYIDSATGNYDKIPLSNSNVYLTDVATTDNYLLSTSSDTDGYFKFTHTPNTSIYLFAKAEINGKSYNNLITAKKDKSNEMILYPDISSTLNLIVLDSFNSPVNGINVKLYVNYSIAFADSIPNGTGSIDSKLSNLNGLVVFNGLNSNRYYIRVNQVINGISFKKFCSFDFIKNTKTDTTIVIQ